MEKGVTLISWDVFLHELQKRFGTSIYDDPRGKIAKLVQLGKASQYQAMFESLMTRITGVPDSMFLNFFEWGLKTEIGQEILMARLDDLSDAIAKAQLFEIRKTYWDIRGKNIEPWRHRIAVPQWFLRLEPSLVLMGFWRDLHHQAQECNNSRVPKF